MHTIERCIVSVCLEGMTDREAEALKRRWRQGSAATVTLFLAVLGLFLAGIFLPTQQ
jgi:hypothetical protein